MTERRVSRRSFMKAAALAAGGSVLAACAPQQAAAPTTAVEPEKIVVKETVMVEGESKTVEKIITATPPSRETVNITWWQAPIWRFGPDNTTVLGPGSDAKGLDLIQRFEAANPWVKIKMELIPWDQWTQKLTTGFASGDVGNVMYSVLNPGRAQGGLLEPVDDYLTADMLGNWLPGLQQAVTINNRIYGIPMFVNPHFSTFSQTALEKHGAGDMVAEMGADRDNVTFDMMLSYGEKFGDKSTRYFFGVPNDHGSILYWMFGSWLEAWGVKSWDDAEERWVANESEDAVAAFEWLGTAAEAGILPPRDSLPKWSDCDNFFWSENMAMRFQWPGMRAELEVAQEAGQASKDHKLLYAAFPHKTGDKARATGMTPIAYCVGRTKDPNAREASFLYSYFMAADESNADGILTEGVFPCYKSSIETVQDNPLMADPNVKWVLDKHVTFEPEITGGNWQPVANARSSRIFFEMDPFNYFVQQYQSLMLKQKSAQQMLDEIAKDINTRLGTV
jgi:ABC-type glycerol-3-phosphate transport system substrate-binding protein